MRAKWSTGSSGSRAVRVGLVLAAFAGLTLACAPTPTNPPVTPPGPVAGIGQRQITIDLSGASSYHNTADVTGGSLHATYDGDRIVALDGTVEFAGATSGTASATFSLTGGPTRYTGEVAVLDAAAGIDTSVAHDEVVVTFDDDADGSATASAGGTTIAWSVDTAAATGLEPTLDSLAAGESDFCRDSQRSLLGLDGSELPDAAISTVLHQSRGGFVLSKPSTTPLTVHAWAEPDMATTAAGNTVTLSHRLSCKTKDAASMALAGHPSTDNASCTTLIDRSLDIARSAMTPTQQARFDAEGRQVVTRPDRMAVAGPDWLAPFDDEVLVGDTVELTSSALLVELDDPAYAALPESFRGTHYCTVWSPAWSYWWMTEGAFTA